MATTANHKDHPCKAIEFANKFLEPPTWKTHGEKASSLWLGRPRCNETTKSCKILRKVCLTKAESYRNLYSCWFLGFCFASSLLLGHLPLCPNSLLCKLCVIETEDAEINFMSAQDAISPSRDLRRGWEPVFPAISPRTFLKGGTLTRGSNIPVSPMITVCQGMVKLCAPSPYCHTIAAQTLLSP